MKASLLPAVLAVSALAAVAVPHAQRADEADAPRLIELPVTVTDASGQLVTGLSADRFRLYVDDQPQRVLRVGSDRPVSMAIVVGSLGTDERTIEPRAASVHRVLLPFVQAGHADNELFLAVDRHVSEDLVGGLAFGWWTRITPGDRERLEAIAPGPNTSAKGHLFISVLPHALYAGRTMLERATRPRTVLMFFDSGMEPLASSQWQIDGYSQLDAARKANIEIYGAGVFPAEDERDLLFRNSGREDAIPDPTALNKLSRDTGGLAAHVQTEAELMQAMDRFAREIRSAHTLEFESPTDRKFHRLRVEVSGPGVYTVRTRPDYLAK